MSLGYDHDSLRLHAMQARLLERMATSAQLQRGRLVKEGFPPLLVADVDEAIKSLKRPVRIAKRKLGLIIKGSPLGDWISDTRGLSDAMALVLGCMPPLTDFRGPRSVWKYAGLDVREDGRSPRRKRGELAGFNPELRAFLIVRVGDPIIKVRGPYRAIYDRRKAATLITHPDMLKDGEGCDYCDLAWSKTKEMRAKRDLERERTTVAVDCSGVGGVHWTAGHRHSDARRVMVKEVLVDAWRIAHGKLPRERPGETQCGDDSHPSPDLAGAKEGVA